ncbi:MAG: DUF3618 domain-containing protein [Candidatus Nanopelagicales bacterium]
MSESKSSTSAKAPARTPAEIEADIDTTRQRLVGTMTEIEDRVNPAKVAGRSKNKIQDFYVSPDGPRWNHVAMTAGAVVVGLVGLRVTSRSIRWALSTPASKLPDLVYIPVPREQAGSFAAALTS